MQKSIKAELILVQRVVRDMGDKFGTIREAMHGPFLQSLLKEMLPENDSLHRLAALPVKSACLALAYPIESAEANLRVSEVTNFHIIQVMRGKDIFTLQDHRANTRKVKAEIKKQKEAAHKSAIVGILNQLPRRVSRAHLCVIQRLATGSWLMVLLSTIAGT
jgi:hypothetical protein